MDNEERDLYGFGDGPGWQAVLLLLAWFAIPIVGLVLT